MGGKKRVLKDGSGLPSPPPDSAEPLGYCRRVLKGLLSRNPPKTPELGEPSPAFQNLQSLLPHWENRWTLFSGISCVGTWIIDGEELALAIGIVSVLSALGLPLPQGDLDPEDRFLLGSLPGSESANLHSKEFEHPMSSPRNRSTCRSPRLPGLAAEPLAVSAALLHPKMSIGKPRPLPGGVAR